ncbi:hypothetical protein ANANG_G00195500, partial [Anguilla anguilla]
PVTWPGNDAKSTAIDEQWFFSYTQQKNWGTCLNFRARPCPHGGMDYASANPSQPQKLADALPGASSLLHLVRRTNTVWESFSLSFSLLSLSPSPSLLPFCSLPLLPQPTPLSLSFSLIHAHHVVGICSCLTQRATEARVMSWVLAAILNGRVASDGWILWEGLERTVHILEGPLFLDDF